MIVITKFTLFDVNAFDNGGGRILSRTTFGKALCKGNLNFPKGKICLPGSEKEMPLYFVDDEAFIENHQHRRSPAIVGF